MKKILVVLKGIWTVIVENKDDIEKHIDLIKRLHGVKDQGFKAALAVVADWVRDYDNWDDKTLDSEDNKENKK